MQSMKTRSESVPVAIVACDFCDATSGEKHKLLLLCVSALRICVSGEVLCQPFLHFSVSTFFISRVHGVVSAWVGCG